VGAAEQFEVGKTVQVALTYNLGGPQAWAGSTQYTIAWLRRNHGEDFTAYADYCTHLGCPVHWLQDPQVFLCPCHGSIFNRDGSVAGGPAARPLFHYRTRVRNGRVEIKTEAIPFATVG
jgi:menaquinol-cytochrome c reductase iron-sulfur subunit